MIPGNVISCTIDAMRINKETETNSHDKLLSEVMALPMDVRQQSRTHKDFASSDHIRGRLAAIGIRVNDGKEGATNETTAS